MLVAVEPSLAEPDPLELPAEALTEEFVAVAVFEELLALALALVIELALVLWRTSSPQAGASSESSESAVIFARRLLLGVSIFFLAGRAAIFLSARDFFAAIWASMLFGASPLTWARESALLRGRSLRIVGT